jgi:hypothetical protein
MSKVKPSPFVPDKHVVVIFTLQKIQELELNGFNHQNVIFGLSISPIESGIDLVLDDCFGLSGRLAASLVSLTITPGEPEGS